MKIKMIQAGYESFTGVFGNVAFSGGVSAEVCDVTAASLSAMVLCEPVQDEPAKITRTSQKAAAAAEQAAMSALAVLTASTEQDAVAPAAE